MSYLFIPHLSYPAIVQTYRFKTIDTLFLNGEYNQEGELKSFQFDNLLKSSLPSLSDKNIDDWMEFVLDSKKLKKYICVI